MSKDAMGDRMKAYEAASEKVLPARMPVIIRLDGHKFTKLTKAAGYRKPFDSNFRERMKHTVTALIEYCQGVQVAYTQSDEITLYLKNDQNHETNPFLGNRVQKICSLVAARASMAFNNGAHRVLPLGMFDCRVFIVPEAEVLNAFRWRIYDSHKNCINSYLTHHVRSMDSKNYEERTHGIPTTERVKYLAEQGFLEENIYKWQLFGTKWTRVKKEVLLEDVMPEDIYKKAISQGKIKEGDTVETTKWKIEEVTGKDDTLGLE